MSAIHCRIITPQGLYKELDTPIVNIETTDGQQGILPSHMPLVTMLKIGRLSTIEDGQRKEYAVAGGLFYFQPDTAEILTDSIENSADIDTARAEKAKERAEKRLSSNDPKIDRQRADAALARALNRLSVAEKK